jgi:hypothetical protein
VIELSPPRHLFEVGKQLGRLIAFAQDTARTDLEKWLANRPSHLLELAPNLW